MITKQRVRDALGELRAGRSRANGNRAIRSILRQFGGGVSGINELAVTQYAAVLAAVTIPTAQDFYGVVTDVQPTPQARPTPPTTTATTRPFSPLVKDLTEKLAAARAKTKRSVPNYVVNTGNPAHFGDEDAIPDYPSDGRRMQ